MEAEFIEVMGTTSFHNFHLGLRNLEGGKGEWNFDTQFHEVFFHKDLIIISFPLLKMTLEKLCVEFIHFISFC